MDDTGHESVWADHTTQEFQVKDPSAAMATMTENPFVTHVPVITGGNGRAEVEAFYRDHFVGQTPADFALEPIGRTLGEASLVDELIASFTHDIVMDWLLPGVAPTGRHVQVPVVAVIGFEGGRISFERLYWDQASILVQIGLLDNKDLPVVGVESALKVRDPARKSNTLIHRSIKGLNQEH